LEMRRSLCFFVPAALVLTFALSHAAEQLRPSGFDIGLTYEINQATLNAGDTLVITRTIVNHESFVLTGLYLGESLPTEMVVLDHAVAVNGQVIDYAFSGTATTTLIYGYHTYHWVIDDPRTIGSFGTVLMPGDSLALVLKVIGNRQGDFVLPLHQTVFYGGGKAFFAVGDSAPVITVGACCVSRGDVNGSFGSGGTVNVADLTYLVDYLFNLGPPPPCYEQANADGSSGLGNQVNVGDLTFLVAYLFANSSAPPPCPVSGD